MSIMLPPGLTRLDPPPDALEILAGTDLLGPASVDDIAAVADSVDWLRLDAGTELFAAGAVADGMYLVVRGRLESHIDNELLGEIGRGGTVGETALLGDTLRTASVRAVRDSVVARIPPDRVPELAGRSPGVSLGLARLVARRAAAAPPAVRAAAPPRSIGVVALDGSDIAAELARSVTERLGRRLSARWITGRELASWAGHGGQDQVVARLAQAEDGCGALIVSFTHADATSSERAEDGDDLAATVLRQTDLVVGVAGARGQADRRMLAALGRVRRPLSLAVVHQPGQQPSGTARWLAAVGAHTEVRGHTHLRDGSIDDLDRLTRAVVGRSVGVVLGGGGARGFAHIGVLRALREAGLPIDLVGGTSMGAVMGAQVAMGLTPAEMLAVNTSAWSRDLLIEFGIPTLSLLRGRRATKVIDGFFGERRIEDLWLDYFCTTVDLSDFRLNVARRGVVGDWVRASASVPGLWPPIVDDDGHLHVDGGMLDNVPTDVMRASQAGTVIGVDVCNRQSPMRVAPVPMLPAGLSLLRARRKGQWFPSILDVLNRTNLLASLQHHQAAERYADLFIAPPVEDEGFAAFDRVGKLAEIGYRTAAKVLEGADLSVFGTA